MTYQETLDYMFSALPMYHRIGAAAYKADIQPTIDLMNALGNPERRFRSIHVAGTNGKGSVSHFIASILQEAGYKVGLYTSPHLVDFRERIRINGEMITQKDVTDFITRNKDIIENLKLSFFEMTVGMAFDYFARQKIDVAVVEVGMGGRLDSTNVISPELSVITNIGLDHTQFLGDTLDKIAGEKAGIIKYRIPVVIGQTKLETESVFNAKAKEHHAPIFFADQLWEIKETAKSSAADNLLHIIASPKVGCFSMKLTSQLSGSYQLENIATLMEAIHQIRKQNVFHITDEAIRQGVTHVIDNTHLRGRWEVIGHKPLTICETAHNLDGVQSMLGKLSTMKYSHLHIIYGCVSDKDFSHIINLLPKDATFYFTQPSVPRRLPVNQLVSTAKTLGIDGDAFENVHLAIAKARQEARSTDLVLVTGSIFLVADALGGF